MEQVVGQAEQRGVDRHEIADSTVFVSHETYTPARGGSASAEINALRVDLRRRGRLDRDRQHQGLHRSRHGRRHRGRRGHQGARDRRSSRRCRTSRSPTPSSVSSTSRRAAPTRCATRCGWRPDSARRSPCRCCRWTPMPDGLHRSPSELGYAYRVVDPRRGSAGSTPWAARPVRRSRSRPVGCGSSTHRRRPRSSLRGDGGARGAGRRSSYRRMSRAESSPP